MNQPGDSSALFTSGRRELVLAAILCFLAGSLYGWAALIPVVDMAFEASTAETGFVFSAAVLAFSFAVFMAPRLLAWMSSLDACAWAGCLGAVCLLATSVASNYVWFVLSFSLGFGLCSGAVYMHALTIAARSVRANQMTPIMVASFGLGGVVSGGLWGALVVSGWGATAVWPQALLLCVVGLYVLVSRPRSSADHGRYVALQHDSECVRLPQSRRVTMVLWCVLGFGSLGGLMVLGLSSKMFQAAGGSGQLLAWIVSGIALGNTLGRASVGVLTVKLSPVAVSLCALLVVTLGLLLSRWVDTPAGMSAGLISTALGYGALASAVPILARALIGVERFAATYARVFTAWGMAGLCAPWLAGWMFDTQGNFHGAIDLALGLTLCAGALLLVLARAPGFVLGSEQDQTTSH